MAHIELRDLTKIFATDGVETTALRGVTLEIRAGEFGAVVGPSGSGKSTLFHCLGGLLRPTSGSIKIAGEEITAIPPHRLAEFRLRAVGFVFQSYNLITVLTALENVMLAQYFHSMADEEEAASALASVGLGDRLPSIFSQGIKGKPQVIRIVRIIPADRVDGNDGMPRSA